MQKQLSRLFCLLLIILFSSCTLQINENQTDASLNFKVASEYTDANVIVKLSEEKTNIILDYQIQTVKEGDEYVSFHFSYLPTDVEIRVEASVIKDDIILLSKTDIVTIKNNERKVLNLSLDVKSVYSSLIVKNLKLSDVNGVELEVKINNNIIPPVTLVQGEETATVPLGYFSVGDKIDIEASVKKEGIVLATKKIDQKEITLEDKSISLDIMPETVNLKVKLPNDFPYEQYTAAKLFVTVNEEMEQEVSITKEQNYIDLGAVSTKAPLSITARVENTRNVRNDALNLDSGVKKANTADVLYKAPKQNYEATLDFIVPTLVKEDSYVLWVDAGNAKNRYKVCYGDLPASITYSVDDDLNLFNVYKNTEIGPSSFLDMIYTPDGHFIFSTKESVTSQAFGSDVVSNSEYFNPKTSITINENVLAPLGFNTLCLGKDIIYANIAGTLKEDNPILVKLSSPDIKNKGTIPLVNVPTITDIGFAPDSKIEIVDMVANINEGHTSDIYIAFGENTSNAAKQTAIYKGTISESNITIDKEPIFNTKTFTYKTSGNIFINIFTLTDMKIIDDNLFVLLVETRKFNPNMYSSRGALVKIPINNKVGEVEVIGLHNIRKVSGDINPIYMLKENANELKTNFVGPRKFISSNPNKLIIADSGAVLDKEFNEKECKRIITVDPNTFDFTITEISKPLTPNSSNGGFTTAGSVSLFGGFVDQSTHAYNPGL